MPPVNQKIAHYRLLLPPPPLCWKRTKWLGSFQMSMEEVSHIILSTTVSQYCKSEDDNAYGFMKEWMLNEKKFRSLS